MQRSAPAVRSGPLRRSAPVTAGGPSSGKPIGGDPRVFVGSHSSATFGSRSMVNPSFGSVTSHGKEDPKPMEASGDPRRQRRGLATDSSAEQRPEVEVEWRRARWQHPAIELLGQRREGTGRGDTIPAVDEGKASKGVAPVGRAAASVAAQNLANPMVGCRAQQTCEPVSGEAVGVGRNDMDGPHPSGGTLGSKEGLRPNRVERLPVMSMEGRSLNEPHERSPAGPHDLRVGLPERTARTGMRLRRRRDGGNCVSRIFSAPLR